MDPESVKPIPITTEEERQLRRVFDLLCDYQSKKRIEDEINLIRSNASLKPKDVCDMTPIQTIVEWRVSLGSSSCTQPDSKRLDDLFYELDDLKKVDIRVGEKKISIGDVAAMMKNLKMKINRKDVEEMVWEVDEDLDSALGWKEFRLMFTRNIMDQSGLEPSRMFNLTQFLIYDNNANGKVSLDETMHMLYTRYGKHGLDQKVKEIFGPQANSSGREGGDITFPFYLQAVEKVQMQMFLKSCTDAKLNSLEEVRKSTQK